MNNAEIDRLRLQIAQCQSRITDIEDEIRRLQMIKETLLATESAHHRRVSDYYSAHRAQGADLVDISSTISLRFAKGHRKNIETHMKGEPQHQTAVALDDGTSLLKKGIMRCDEDISDKKRIIQSIQREIHSLRERIAAIQRQMT